MPPEHENPYLAALHELLKQHFRSLHQPLKNLSGWLEALEVEAVKGNQFQEERALLVETSKKEKY
ncbi:MAG: hypothetical protein EA353_11985 [Puniceicoccaceae bacterium]|nr:MAG: hypothetical protein EA353_11985 [Puniceicoccaceae bacterium]